MQLTVSSKSSLPPYIQVANQIEDQIRSGNISKGSRLPSVRTLAIMAGISHVTANKVLAFLAEKRLVERIHGSGSFSIFDSPFGHQDSPHPSDIRSKFKAARKAKEFRAVLVNLLKNTMQACHYNFSYAILEPDLINRLIPSPMDPCLGLHTIKWTRTYGDMGGMQELRHALIDMFVPGCDEECVIVTHGNQHGLHIIAETLIHPGDCILMESPTYTGAMDVFSNAKAQILPVKIYENGFDEQYIEKLCKTYHPKLFYLTPNFSNPTGYCLTYNERKNLLYLSEKYGFVIVEDDPWSELSFEEKVTPLGCMDSSRDKVIYLKGFSKIIGAQYRIGALFADPDLIMQFRKKIMIQSLGVSELTQFYLLSLLRNGIYKNAIPKIVMDLKKRSVIVNQSLSVLRRHGVQYNMASGGLNTWIELPGNIYSEELLFNATYPRGITFLPGSLANSAGNSSCDSSLRLSYGYLSLNSLKSGLSRFVEIVAKELVKR